MEIPNEHDHVDVSQLKVLNEAISDIRHSPSPDTDLLDILVRHIVTLSSKNDAIGQAADEIKKLAEERTNS